MASLAVIRRQKPESPIQSVHSLINRESEDDLIPHRMQYEIQKLTHLFQRPLEQIENMQKTIEYFTKRDTTFDKKIEEIYQKAKKLGERDNKIQGLTLACIIFFTSFLE